MFRLKCVLRPPSVISIFIYRSLSLYGERLRSVWHPWVVTRRVIGGPEGWLEPVDRFLEFGSKINFRVIVPFCFFKNCFLFSLSFFFCRKCTIPELPLLCVYAWALLCACMRAFDGACVCVPAWEVGFNAFAKPRSKAHSRWHLDMAIVPWKIAVTVKVISSFPVSWKVAKTYDIL